MNFVWFLIAGILIFLSLLLGGKKYRSTALYALAIGGIVNANFFHAGNYPIDCFGLPFGIDSIIYTLFIFCVIVMLLKENKKSAYTLGFSSIIAIVFSAAMQLLADLLSNGSTTKVWLTFLGFIISALASVITIIVMIETLEKLKNKLNKYLIIIIGIILSTIINTAIYYPLITLINGVPNNIWTLLLTSFIGKFISLNLSLLTYFLIEVFNKKSNAQ